MELIELPTDFSQMEFSFMAPSRVYMEKLMFQSIIGPTGGAAKSHSALGVHTFMKRIPLAIGSLKDLEAALPHIKTCAKMEGLHMHWECVEARIKTIGG